MLKKHSQLFEGLFAASDLVVVSAAWMLSYWVRFFSEWVPAEKGIPPLAEYVKMLIFVWLIWAFVFRRMRLYRPMRGTSRWREIWMLIQANAVSVVLLLAATYLFREKDVPYSRLVFAIFWGISTVLTIGSRTFLRAVLRHLRRRGFNQRFALIVGAEELAERVLDSMSLHPEYGLELIGCLANDSEYEGIHRSLRHAEVAGLTVDRQALRQPRRRMESRMPMRVVGTYSDLPRFIESGQVDQVIIAMPLADHDKLEAVINSVGDSMVDVRIVPDVHRFIQLGSRIEEFDGLPVISLASTPLMGVNRVAKRIVDILLGAVLIVALAPLMGLIVLIIKLTSRGPVFFVQERVGLDGRTFLIYKFRTMRLDAERDGARFAIKDDPRTTRLGKFLRQSSLDELPQLFNVVKGEMSLVGPRPERPVFISEFRRHVPRYMLRHKVQAGMTGWAQVNGWRGNTSIERRIEHDLYYIEHWSLGLDLKILGLTLVNGIRNRNAY